MHKNKFFFSLSLLLISNILYSHSTKTFSKRSFEFIAEKYGKNKWVCNDTTKNRWGDEKKRDELVYFQIVNGSFHSTGKYTTDEDVTIMFIVSENSKHSISCSVGFDLLRPAFSGNQKISVRNPKSQRAKDAVLSQSFTPDILNLDCFSFILTNFQSLHKNLTNPSEGDKLIETLDGNQTDYSLNEILKNLQLNNDDEYLELLIEDDNWWINTRIYGKSPI